MSAFRFQPWSRRALENDLKPGDGYRR